MTRRLRERRRVLRRRSRSRRRQPAADVDAASCGCALRLRPAASLRAAARARTAASRQRRAKPRGAPHGRTASEATARAIASTTLVLVGVVLQASASSSGFEMKPASMRIAGIVAPSARGTAPDATPRSLHAGRGVQLGLDGFRRAGWTRRGSRSAPGPTGSARARDRAGPSGRRPARRPPAARTPCSRARPACAPRSSVAGRTGSRSRRRPRSSRFDAFRWIEMNRIARLWFAIAVRSSSGSARSSSRQDDGRALALEAGLQAAARGRASAPSPAARKGRWHRSRRRRSPDRGRSPEALRRAAAGVRRRLPHALPERSRTRRVGFLQLERVEARVAVPVDRTSAASAIRPKPLRIASSRVPLGRIGGDRRVAGDLDAPRVLGTVARRPSSETSATTRVEIPTRRSRP